MSDPPRRRGSSIGIVQPEGRVNHLAGQLSQGENEQVVGHRDVAAQTHQCFRNFEKVLAAVSGP